MQTLSDDHQLDKRASRVWTDFLQQIPDEENVADMLTKIITAKPFRTKAARLLGNEVVGQISLMCKCCFGFIVTEITETYVTILII